MHQARKFSASGTLGRTAARNMNGAMRVTLLCCSLLAAGVVTAEPAATLPVPADLGLDAAEAGREGKPLILFFSLPGCQFCHVVRQNYLSPMLKTGNVGGRPLIREIDITSQQKVKGFDGSPGTQLAIAKQYGIRVAPTVLFVDARGRLLTEPIVGGDVSGIYGGYLDNAFAEAEKRLAALAAD
jgi:thioredoxin-related protein